MLAALGYALVGANLLNILIGTSHANRPHEIEGRGLGGILLVGHVFVCVGIAFASRAALRARGPATPRVRLILAHVFAAGYGVLALLLFVALGRDLLRLLGVIDC